MSKVVLALSMALMAGGVCSQAQSFVQISSVRAYPPRLTADTLPGVISIGVTISSVPEGILIKEPAQQALVELKIEPPR